jgi:hypothetical protein
VLSRKTHQRLDSIERQLAEAQQDLRDQRLALARLSSGIEALLRKTFLEELTPGDGGLGPVGERFGITSQGEEDGIVISILRRVGSGGRRAVELGCGPNGGNCGLLALELGWRALMVDGDPKAVAAAARNYSGADVRVVHQWITAENANDLVRGEAGGVGIDYLGIDLDGNDFWVWRAIEATPRLVVVEFNPSFGPTAALTIPYEPTFDWSRRERPRPYFGASLAALEALGREKGYRLVAVDPLGANAFFAAEDLAGPDLPHRSAQELWRPPRKGGMREPLRHEDGVVAWFAEHGCEVVDVSPPAQVGGA